MTCPHAQSKWVGIVSNNPHPPITGAHMSQVTCARESCIKRAISEVAGFTNQTARLYTYEELRAS